MDSKEFKKMFDESARNHTFQKVAGGWYKESAESLSFCICRSLNSAIMKLALKCKIVDYPFGEETQSKSEVWGEIKIDIVDNNDQIVHSILDIQWDIIPLVNWIKVNCDAIVAEKFPFQEVVSLACSIQQFYKDKIPDDSSDEPLSDEIESMIYKMDLYKRSHGLTFALRGTKIDNIYLGLFNDVMPVSVFHKSKNWSYEVNISDFLLQANYITKSLC